MLQEYVRPVHRLRGPEPEDEGALGERLAARVTARQRERQELQALLGVPLYTRTTILPLVAGGYLGPACDRTGRELIFGMWSPHRRVIIDVFPRLLPSTQELEDREAWARANGLRYAIVRPGMKLTTESLRAWLAQGDQKA